MPADIDHEPSLPELRRSMRRQRTELPLHVQTCHSIAVHRHLVASGLLLAGRTFGVYAAVRGELDPGPTIDHLLDAGQTVALPVIDTGARMDFYRITATTQSRRNAFGILEPDPLYAPFQPPIAIDVVFAPLVAFDTAGYRLGMGGGYYDRYLSPAHELARRPLLIGLAHAFQEVARLAHAPWDVPLDMVITEQGATAFSRRAVRFARSSPTGRAQTDVAAPDSN